MREIILDTETTGFKPEEGHRIVEIGCLEVYQNLPTGKSLQLYINPERDMPEGAFKVHGISSEFLADKPLFADVVDEFLEFIGEDPLVIHNAPFDMKFLNSELRWAGKPALKNKPIDTVVIARELFPGSPVNLDALCRRFEIDNSSRTYHGALLDCELLAEVYLELRGGRQHGFDLGAKSRKGQNVGAGGSASLTLPSGKKIREARPHPISEEELAAHAAMLEKLSDPLWKK
ncbi:DNA polymerase III subunit epsilon [Kiloniella laminariae]|uniref:DNA polymerase III subunit epsilon n=1 Tax=Kiloniella laminariae TaxID=454162 RepID=A0ABT4LJA4_9PROT|nr:DNA polymerase III subunit epsilon [Kiloniella laminariae]MCZ4281186.1 DNA polymerase III subunit epsilon [Kiloniella laminariae]